MPAIGLPDPVICATRFASGVNALLVLPEAGPMAAIVVLVETRVASA